MPKHAREFEPRVPVAYHTHLWYFACDHDGEAAFAGLPATLAGSCPTTAPLGAKRTRPGASSTFAWDADGVTVGVKYLVDDIANRVNNQHQKSAV